jgi:hypothetical protein
MNAIQNLKRKKKLNMPEEHPVELFDNSVYGSKKEISIFMVKRRRIQMFKNLFYYFPIFGMIFLYNDYSRLNYRWFNRNYNKILWTNILFLSILTIFMIFLNFYE